MPQKNPTLVVGITGGAGSGKTTVAGLFRKWGAAVIDADAIGHSLLAQDSPCYGQIIKAFGEGILHRNRRIDRRALGALVFGDRRRMGTLNRIVHPHLVRIIKEQIAHYKKHQGGLVAVDAALIVQWGLQRQLDRLIVVEAPAEVRLCRLAGKGLPAGRARQIMDSQLPDARLRREADVVIVNDGGLDDLRRKAVQTWDGLRAAGAA